MINNSTIAPMRIMWYEYSRRDMKWKQLDRFQNPFTQTNIIQCFSMKFYKSARILYDFGNLHECDRDIHGERQNENNPISIKIHTQINVTWCFSANFLRIYATALLFYELTRMWHEYSRREMIGDESGDDVFARHKDPRVSGQMVGRPLIANLSRVFRHSEVFTRVRACAWPSLHEYRVLIRPLSRAIEPNLRTL